MPAASIEELITYPSMLIDGLLWEKFGTRPCKSCGSLVSFVGVRCERRSDKDGGIRIDGRTVQMGKGFTPECHACAAMVAISGQLRLLIDQPRLLDRGVPREAVRLAAEYNRSSRTAIGGLVAEALDEVLKEYSAVRITKDAMRGSRFSAILGPIIANLEDDASPPDPLFRTGPVRFGSFLRPGLVTGVADLGRFIDRHCLGDHGDFGPIAAGLGEQARFSIDLATVAERNQQALDTGVGVVQSRYLATSNLYEYIEYIIDIYTLLRNGGASTMVIART